MCQARPSGAWLRLDFTHAGGQEPISASAVDQASARSRARMAPPASPAPCRCHRPGSSPAASPRSAGARSATNSYILLFLSLVMGRPAIAGRLRAVRWRLSSGCFGRAGPAFERLAALLRRRRQLRVQLAGPHRREQRVDPAGAARRAADFGAGAPGLVQRQRLGAVPDRENAPCLRRPRTNRAARGPAASPAPARRPRWSGRPAASPRTPCPQLRRQQRLLLLQVADNLGPGASLGVGRRSRGRGLAQLEGLQHGHRRAPVLLSCRSLYSRRPQGLPKRRALARPCADTSEAPVPPGRRGQRRASRMPYDARAGDCGAWMLCGAGQELSHPLRPAQGQEGISHPVRHRPPTGIPPLRVASRQASGSGMGRRWRQGRAHRDSIMPSAWAGEGRRSAPPAANTTQSRRSDERPSGLKPILQTGSPMAVWSEPVRTARQCTAITRRQGTAWAVKRRVGGG